MRGSRCELLVGDGERKGEDAGDLDEDDEMIWWSWDGKIVGFADW